MAKDHIRVGWKFPVARENIKLFSLVFLLFFASACAIQLLEPLSEDLPCDNDNNHYHNQVISDFRHCGHFFKRERE